MWERGPGELEIDGRESHIKVVVEVGELRIEHIADFLTLERAGCSVDGKFSHDLWNIKGALLSLERFVALDEVFYLGRDQGDVRTKSILGKTEFDKL